MKLYALELFDMIYSSFVVYGVFSSKDKAELAKTECISNWKKNHGYEIQDHQYLEIEEFELDTIKE